MNQDQCIEVAEKVWGWKVSPYNDDDIAIRWTEGTFEDGELGGISAKQVFFSEFNSWEGFGRTVEAMAGRKYFPILNPSREDVPGLGKMERMQVIFIYPSYSKGDSVLSGEANFQVKRLVEYTPQFVDYLIEATHLAALEALKEEE